MDFGVVLQTDPPVSRVLELTRRAESNGFTYGWTFDSHVLWQEPFVIYSQMLSETDRMIVGPMVTNPGTRDWTVTASLFATLNEMFGNRTVCGIGRGDSAMRVIGRTPSNLATLSESMKVIKGLAEGREVTYNGTQVTTAQRDQCMRIESQNRTHKGDLQCRRVIAVPDQSIGNT